MTRLLLICVAIAAGLAFTVAVPTLAVAGIQAVPVASVSVANSDACTDEARDLPAFTIELCKKKSQAGKTLLCQQLHAVVPAGLCSPVAPVAKAPAGRADMPYAEAGPNRLLRPPRG